jgi:hypothetical protein
VVRNATAEDIAFVVKNMRPEDVREIWLLAGIPATEAIAEIGKWPYVALVIWRDEPVAIFGATLAPDGETAHMFRFATPAWPSVVKEAIRFGKRMFLDKMREAGVRQVFAKTVSESDTGWLKLFGAKECGGGVAASGAAFKTFMVDLAEPVG